MIVEFQNTFRVPGFGRNRFMKGICKDVPENFRGKLPRTAKVLDDYVDPKVDQQKQDELIAADAFRAAGDTSQDALERAGLAGMACEGSDSESEEDTSMVFNGKEYATPAALKAAKTRFSKRRNRG